MDAELCLINLGSIQTAHSHLLHWHRLANLYRYHANFFVMYCVLSVEVGRWLWWQGLSSDICRLQTATTSAYFLRWPMTSRTSLYPLYHSLRHLFFWRLNHFEASLLKSHWNISHFNHRRAVMSCADAWLLELVENSTKRWEKCQPPRKRGTK